MGNALTSSKRKKTAKIMKIDGTTLRLRPPVQASAVLLDHPGHHLLNADDVKSLGLRAQPLHPDHPLASGKLYFLVELPRLPEKNNNDYGPPPRRAWSGALHVGARERLESLKMTRRSVSDLAAGRSCRVEEGEEGMRVRMRLPKADVARVVEESRDAAEAAKRIMELCVKKEEEEAAAAVEKTLKRRKEVKKRTRFLLMPEEIIA